MIFKRLISFVFMLISCGVLKSQSYEDSLLNLLDIDSVHMNKEAMFLLGEHLVQLKPLEAETYADQLSQWLVSPVDSTDWCRINYIYAASHRWQGNYATALSYYQQNYDYYQRQNNKEQMARSGAKIGTINTFLGNNILAQQYLLESSEIYEDLGTVVQKASSHNRLAGLYLNIDQFEKGKQLYIQALTEFTSINDSAGMSSAHANLGYIYTELGDYEQAEAHFMIEKGLNEFFPTKREMAFHHDFMGLLRQKQGRLDEAYEEHFIALEMRKDLSSTYNLCESKLNVADILIQMGKHEEAIGHLQDVLSYEEHNSYHQESAAHWYLSLAYEKLKNYEAALQNFKFHKAITDSIYNENSLRVITEKEAQYKKKEQDDQIKILNQESEIAKQRAARSEMIIYGSLVGLFIFLLLSFFVFRLYLKVKRQKDVISVTLDEKEILLKEIHHRVKNNLQIISSLLSLQSRYIEDKKVQAAVNDGQNRVKSMALIHQKLYQNNNLMGVEALDYIKNLTRTLMITYGIKQEKIDISYDIDQLKIDVDTIIPIGLILNELISNSFKHAFPGERNGKLRIVLREAKGNLDLIVVDDGVGANQCVDKSKSFGMQMIRSLALKLEANVNFNFTNGTEASLAISKYKLV